MEEALAKEIIFCGGLLSWFADEALVEWAPSRMEREASPEVLPLLLFKWELELKLSSFWRLTVEETRATISP